MNRRSFLKLLGASTAAVVAAPIITPAVSAPLYIPPQRLDYGVPREILTATVIPDQTVTRAYLSSSGAVRTEIEQGIPMTLLWDEFSPIGWQQFGREKVPAGTTLMVDETTARRWISRGVAAAAPNAPYGLQFESAKRLAAKKRRDERSQWTVGVATAYETTMEPYVRLSDGDRRVMSVLERAQRKAEVDAGWDRMFASARADGWDVES